MHGTPECLITLHTLTHVPEDIKRFSSPDIFWCCQYERAVGRYVRQTSNKKGIEKTFARDESQREFIKFDSKQYQLGIQESESGKYDKIKMVATSLKAAQYLAKVCESTTDATRANCGILIGSGHIHIVQPAEENGIVQCMINSHLENHPCPQFVTSYRSALRPLQNAVTGGTVYQTGDTVLASQDNGRGHVVVKILNLYLISVGNQNIPVAIGDLYKSCRNDENQILRHPFSDSVIIEPHQTNFCVHLQDLKRKIMLYPYNDGYALLDPNRTLKLPRVVVPVFPQVGDMLLLKDDNDEIWRSEVRSVDHASQSVKGYLFVQYRNWNVNHLWQRESQRRALDVIHFKSILGIADGQWQGPYWKDNGI